MVTQQQLKEFATLHQLERKVLLRSMQVQMLGAVPDITPIVREFLCRAIVVDVSQAEMALLAARQMCENKEVRKAIDDLLQFAAHLHSTTTGQLITGDFL